MMTPTLQILGRQTLMKVKRMCVCGKIFHKTSIAYGLDLYFNKDSCVMNLGSVDLSMYLSICECESVCVRFHIRMTSIVNFLVLWQGSVCEMNFDFILSVVGILYSMLLRCTIKENKCSTFAYILSFSFLVFFILSLSSFIFFVHKENKYIYILT